MPSTDARTDHSVTASFSSFIGKRSLLVGPDRLPAQISWEAAPSRKINVLPRLFEAPLEQQHAYLCAINEVFSPNHGVTDVVAARIGLNMQSTTLGSSAYEGNVGFGAQTFTSPVTPPASPRGWRREPSADALSTLPDTAEPSRQRTSWPALAKLLNLYAAIRGLVLQQDAVVWHMPARHANAQQHNAVEIEAVHGDDFSLEHIQSLYDEISKNAGHHEWAPAHDGSNKLKIINFRSDQSNIEFQSAVKDALLTMEQVNPAFPASYVHTFKVIGELVGTDWINDGGQTYRDLIHEHSTRDLREWIHYDLAPQIQTINDEFSMRFHWGPSGNLHEVTRPLVVAS
ncbi:MAG TPA: hypothetical protein VFS42_03875 [Burkholderiaceae bacterium]|nr:hypothetical protein [Burkholderiaceae bacterium]